MAKMAFETMQPSLNRTESDEEADRILANNFPSFRYGQLLTCTELEYPELPLPPRIVRKDVSHTTQFSVDRLEFMTNENGLFASIDFKMPSTSLNIKINPKKKHLSQKLRRRSLKSNEMYQEMYEADLTNADNRTYPALETLPLNINCWENEIVLDGDSTTNSTTFYSKDAARLRHQPKISSVQQFLTKPNYPAPVRPASPQI